MMTWQTTALLIALILVIGSLGLAHVLDAAWIERTYSILIGFAAGHAIGARKQKDASGPGSGT